LFLLLPVQIGQRGERVCVIVVICVQPAMLRVPSPVPVTDALAALVESLVDAVAAILGQQRGGDQQGQQAAGQNGCRFHFFAPL